MGIDAQKRSSLSAMANVTGGATMKWFKHDAAANMDAKLQSVLLEYGMEGYGLYWYCLELIAQTVTPENITFELEHDSRVIARNTGLGVQKVQEIMTHFVNLGLFESDNGVISCIKLAQRTDDYINKISRLRLSGQSTDIVRTKSEKVVLDQIRSDKKRKEKDKAFSKPTIQEIKDYILEIKGTINAATFYNHYETVGWKVGKNAMKDWKAAVRGWQLRQNERGQ
jgi:hypothetical protein